MSTFARSCSNGKCGCWWKVAEDHGAQSSRECLTCVNRLRSVAMPEDCMSWFWVPYIGLASWFGLFLFHLDIKEPVVRVAVQVVKDILLQMPGHGHLTR
jgi:hypothetical protein